MTTRSFLTLALLVTINVTCKSQDSVQINLRITDSSSNDVAKYSFEVTITNNTVKTYLVQDTAYMKSYVSAAASNHIIPEIEILINGTYKWIGMYKWTGIGVPNDCLIKCCNCHVLNKGSSLTFGINILECCDWKEGAYRVRVRTSPLLLNDNPRFETLGELYSNYISFSVKN